MLLLLLLFCASASAAAPTWEPNTALWASFTARSVPSTPYNPDNRVARVPRETETLELRPDWKLSAEKWRITARPRLILESEKLHAAGMFSRDSSLLLRWSEGFATWNLSEAFTLSYGLQNFQWGPAESSSPSNRIFRDTVQARDSLYVEKGKHLIKIAWVPSASWSEVFLFEPTGNGDPEPEPGEPHATKAALKSEITWAGGSDFAGLVTGWRNRAGPWLGEYGNLQLFDGLFFYADASQNRGSLAFYPAPDPTGALTVFTQSHRYDARVYTFAVTGLRYAFENGNDARVEWIFQEAGYRGSDFTRARGAFLSTNFLQVSTLAVQSEAARQPGLDFPGVHTLFSSVRFPNAFGYRDWTIYWRGLRSLQDASMATFLSSENATGEHGSLIASVGAGVGAPGTELKGAVDLAGTLAYRHAW